MSKISHPRKSRNINFLVFLCRNVFLNNNSTTLCNTKQRFLYLTQPREISYAASRFSKVSRVTEFFFIIEKVDNIPLVERIWKRHQRDTHSHTHAHTIKINDSLFPNFDEFYFLTIERRALL